MPEMDVMAVQMDAAVLEMRRISNALRFVHLSEESSVPQREAPVTPPPSM